MEPRQEGPGLGLDPDRVRVALDLRKTRRRLNQPEVESALQRNYPPTLRDAGIGGRATVWFFIDVVGTVLDTRLKESSGYDQMDRAALAVAEVMRFSPAWNRDKKVEVWVSIPIGFESRD